MILYVVAMMLYIFAFEVDLPTLGKLGMFSLAGMLIYIELKLKEINRD